MSLLYRAVINCRKERKRLLDEAYKDLYKWMDENGYNKVTYPEELPPSPESSLKELNHKRPTFRKVTIKRKGYYRKIVVDTYVCKLN